MILKRRFYFFALGLLLIGTPVGFRSLNRRAHRKPVIARTDGSWPIRVATLNTHLLPPLVNFAIGKRHSGTYRASAIATRLREYNLVGICEAFHETNASTLIDTFNAKDSKSFALVRSDSPTNYFHLCSGGLILLSQFPMTAKASMKFSSGSRLFTSGFKSGDGLAAKGAVYARIEVGDTDTQKVDCFLTHLDSHSPTIRSAQLAELVAFINACREVKNPLIIMGDFNIAGPSAGSNSPTDEYFSLIKQLSFREIQITDACGTVASLNEKLAQGTGDALRCDGGARIDYIFAGTPTSGTPFEVTNAQTLPLRDANLPGGSLSDHVAVTATIRR